MKKIVSSFSLEETLGISPDCMLFTIKYFLRHYGYMFNESICYGLGCGLEFYYSRKPPGKSFFFIGGRRDNILNHLCSNLNIRLETKSGYDSMTAFKNVKQLIDNDATVYVNINAVKILPYVPRFFTLDFIDEMLKERIFTRLEHQNLIVGYDDEKSTVYLCDAVSTRLLEVPWEVFIESWNDAAEFVEKKNEYYWCFTRQNKFPLKKAIYRSIETTVDLMQNPVVFKETGGDNWMWCGLPALLNFVKEFPEWPKMLDKKSLTISIFLAYNVSALMSGGGFYRKHYSRFLFWASEVLGISELRNIAVEYENIAQKWDSLLKKCYQELDTENYNLFTDTETINLLNSIYEKEHDAILRLQKIIE